MPSISRDEHVKEAARLVAELTAANGDSPEQGEEYRERLRLAMRRLALTLWGDPKRFD